MKNFAKLALLFSLGFVIIFLAASGCRFLALRVDWAKNLPPKPETSLTLIIAAAHWALSLSLFSTILFSISYSIRKNYFVPMSIISVMCLSMLFCFGVSAALKNWGDVPPAQTAGIPLGGNGLILSNSLNRNETAVILLKGNMEPLGARVVAVPNQPLVFQETAGTFFFIPPVQFGDDVPLFLRNLAIDIRLNAGIFQMKFNESFFQLFIYAGSLIFLLCSLSYAIRFSVWPLANLFIGILAFRGILAVETFLSTPEMQEVIDSFIGNMVPVTLALPLLFLLSGALLNLYSLLTFAVKRRTDDDS